MKLRSLGILLVLVLALAAGCRKEEPEPEKETSKKEEQPEKQRAPKGFAKMEEEVFITKQPVRVEQYVNYLNATGQDIPEWVQSPAIDYQDPVTGLEKQEAGELARFLKLRLPTPEEWEKASDVVGNRPYPLSEEASEDAIIHLVRDWGKGDDGEKAAARARQKLFDQINQMHRDVIKKKAEQLKQLQQKFGNKVKEQWQAFKKSLTDVKEDQKAKARKAAQAKGQETVFKILQRVGDEKKKIIHAKFKEETNEEAIEKAKKSYSDFLKTQRDNLKELSDKVVEDNQALSEQARELMKELEGEADSLIHNINNPTTGFVVRSEQVEDPQTMGALRGKITRELDSLRSAAEQMQKQLKQTEKDLEAKAKDLEEQIAEVKEKSMDEKIATVKKKIQAINDNLDAQFEQEPHLFKELQEYTELVATKKALQQEIAVLEEALEIFKTPEEMESVVESTSDTESEESTDTSTEESVDQPAE